MSDRNNKIKLTGFLRYQKGEMTGEERNSFERELQKDPFAEESAEGFSQISVDQAAEDISILQKRLRRKVTRRSFTVFYRAAAAFAVLMTVSAIFFINQSKKPVVTLSKNISQEIHSPVPGKETEALPEPAVKAPGKKKIIPSASPQKSKADDQSDKVKDAELLAAEPKLFVINDSEVTKPDLFIVSADEAVVESSATEEKMKIARAAGAPANAKSEKSRNYVPPLPVVGKDSFDLYLERNTRNPEPENPIKQVVMLRFKVQIDGTTTGIKIISSPGKAWSKEAIRLIKSGPRWKPAEDNGKIIEEEVRVNIEFK